MEGLIEIIPNWHPVAVHFPIALVISSTVFFIMGGFFKLQKFKELLIASRWCLWGAGLLSPLAAIFGWIAYNSVAHDAPAHAAMILHKNWALLTTFFIILLAFYSYFLRNVWGVKKKWLTLIFLVLSTLLISSTGWLGGEVVYRHGIGVQRLPNTSSHTHSGSLANSLHHNKK